MSLKGPFWEYSADGREFIINKRDLPQPWHNYISTDGIKLILKHTGAGPSFGRSPGEDRYTDESNPRLVYLRDATSGEFWTASGVVGPAPAGWQCRHGFGYTTIISAQHGIRSETTIFVPTDEPVEVWRIRLTNESRKARTLDALPLAIWGTAHARHEINRDNVYCQRGIIYSECWHWAFADFRNSYPRYNRTWDRVGFMAMSPAPTSFDTTLPGFTGRDGSLNAPAAVAAGKCSNLVQRGLPPCGAFATRVKLKAGQSAELVVLVGAARDKADARRIVANYNSPAKAAKALDAVARFWDEYLGRMTITTPDDDITTFANGWNRYAMLQRYYHRMGYRDTAQDVASYAPIDPQRLRARVGMLCEAQFRSGNTYHDVAMLGFPQHVTINSDPPAWLPWVVGTYCRETGDLNFLKQKFAWADGGAASVYDHCVRALDWYRRESGLHGLPLLKSGDWNDCLQGSWRKGVSVWLAQFLCIGLADMAEIAARTGRPADARRFAAYRRKLVKAINDKCWDGRWYVRAFDDDGKPIGTRREKEGRIFINSQSWSVLSGVATPQRARQCMESVRKLMDLPVGIPLVAPPYTKIQERVGAISRMAPGVHHNGGSWNHAVTWAIIAECRIGRPDRALEIYRRLMPAYLSQTWPSHRSEPYIHASHTDGPMSGYTGRTGVGFNTGTVCWIYRALHEGFAGITAEWEGLRIDPSLPKEWDRLSVRRRYRDNIFEITIEDPQRVGRGVRSVTVDGEQIQGNLVPAVGGQRVRKVRVVLGR
jgi:cellobiose phosphorylase